MAFFFASEINRRSSNEDSYCQMEIRMNAEAAVKAMVVAEWADFPGANIIQKRQ